MLDPFCGTGTVLLESILKERRAIGVDSNPLACLISKVKTQPIPPKTLALACEKLFRRLDRAKASEKPSVVNMNTWFYPHVIEQLCRIRHRIDTFESEIVRDFFLICLSACIRRVSLADPRVSVPVRLRAEQYPQGHPFRAASIKRIRQLKRINVFDVFSNLVKEASAKLLRFSEEVQGNNVSIVQTNAKSLALADLPGNVRPNLIITSPPYAGAQKYVRASSLSLGWLSLCTADDLRILEADSIGREHYHKVNYRDPVVTGIEEADRALRSIRKINPLREHIAGNYLVEMKQALASSMNLLKKNGYIVIVAGNNYVCGHQFKTAQYLKKALVELGGNVILE